MLRPSLLHALLFTESPPQGFDVARSGDGRVAMIGFPSVGKSSLLNQLTETESVAAGYEFTTLTCIPGNVGKHATHGMYMINEKWCFPERALCVTTECWRTIHSLRPVRFVQNCRLLRVREASARVPFIYKRFLEFLVLSHA